MLSRAYSAHLVGLKPAIVVIETDISRGLNSFSIVGLADKAVQEAKDRITTAIKNSGPFAPPPAGGGAPQGGAKKIVVSLAPAHIKKEGTAFDLSIALAHLSALGAITCDFERKVFLGELALGGELRAVRGALILANHARKHGFREVYVPAENASETALVPGITVFGARTLTEVANHLAGAAFIAPHGAINAAPSSNRPASASDFSLIRGQESAKRALEIAAAGGHNCLMSGPPGTGKTMLARAFADILPPLSRTDMLEITGIHSAAGILSAPIVTQAPFRSPHHTSSYAAIVGGGAILKPGEITLAHRGVLFLDEFPEFERRVIEALRQPLEDRVISISRARDHAQFPANFILIAAMNPCPCGNRNHTERHCTCTYAELQKYDRKMSGPIMDRIDMCVEVPAISYEKLSSESAEGESSEVIRERVARSRAVQRTRFAGTPIRTNAEMSVRELRRFAALAPDVSAAFNTAAAKLALSGRAYHRMIKLARTIADMTGSSTIETSHLFEALNYRHKTAHTL